LELEVWIKWSKYEVASSNPRTAKQKQKTKKPPQPCPPTKKPVRIMIKMEEKKLEKLQASKQF
jgi:hypothetical protein